MVVSKQLQQCLIFSSLAEITTRIEDVSICDLTVLATLALHWSSPTAGLANVLEEVKTVQSWAASRTKDWLPIMGTLSICFVVILIVYGPCFGRGWGPENFQGKVSRLFRKLFFIFVCYCSCQYTIVYTLQNASRDLRKIRRQNFFFPEQFKTPEVSKLEVQHGAEISARAVQLLSKAFCPCNPVQKRSLSNDDGDGNANVISKYNFSFSKIFLQLFQLV